MRVCCFPGFSLDVYSFALKLYGFRYRAIFDSLLRRGMTPNATLHHFTHPQWFDQLGGWTKAENIQLFVNYAVKVGWAAAATHACTCECVHMCVREPYGSGSFQLQTATAAVATSTAAYP